MIDVDSTVYETELNPFAVIVCNPLLALIVNETVLVDTSGHA